MPSFRRAVARAAQSGRRMGPLRRLEAAAAPRPYRAFLLDGLTGFATIPYNESSADFDAGLA